MKTRAYIDATEVALLFGGENVVEDEKVQLEFVAKTPIMANNQLSGYQVVFCDQRSGKVFAFDRLRQPSDGLICYEVVDQDETVKTWKPVA